MKKPYLFKSVFIGWAIYFLSQLLFSLLLFITNQDSLFLGNYHYHFKFFYFLLFLILSGYYTVKFSTGTELRAPLILSVIVLFSSILKMLSDVSTSPDWYQVYHVIVIIPSIMTGGFIRMKQYHNH